LTCIETLHRSTRRSNDLRSRYTKYSMCSCSQRLKPPSYESFILAFHVRRRNRSRSNSAPTSSSPLLHAPLLQRHLHHTPHHNLAQSHDSTLPLISTPVSAACACLTDDPLFVHLCRRLARSNTPDSTRFEIYRQRDLPRPRTARRDLVAKSRVLSAKAISQLRSRRRALPQNGWD